LSVFIDQRSVERVCLYYGLRVLSQKKTKIKIKIIWCTLQPTCTWTKHTNVKSVKADFICQVKSEHNRAGKNSRQMHLSRAIKCLNIVTRFW